MNYEKPLFTVIIPVYKHFEYLKDCIDSVVCQTYPKIELIVVDDGSGDFDADHWTGYIKNIKTKNIVSSMVYSNDSNLGTVKSLNGAIKKSAGDIIKIIAGDDALFDCSTLSGIEESINQSPLLCFVGNVMLCDESLNETGLADNRFILSMDNKSTNKLFSQMSVRNHINASGVVFKKAFFNEYGLFDESFRLLEDWPTWLKVFRNGDRIGFIDCVVAKRRVTTGVVSNNNPFYLDDRKKTWTLILKKERKMIGPKNYMSAFIVSHVFTIPFFRKIAYLFCKKR